MLFLIITLPYCPRMTSALVVWTNKNSATYDTDSAVQQNSRQTDGLWKHKTRDTTCTSHGWQIRFFSRCDNTMIRHVSTVRWYSAIHDSQVTSENAFQRKWLLSTTTAVAKCIAWFALHTKTLRYTSQRTVVHASTTYSTGGTGSTRSARYQVPVYEYC